MTPEEFLKKEGYFDSPHFPFDHVAGLMYRYAQSQHDGKPIVSGSLPLDDYVSKAEYDKAIEEIGRLQAELSKADDYINDLSRGYEH